MIIIFCIFFIILFHELGHFLTAKWLKCGVKVFSIGFGRKLWGFQFKKTYYQITPFLLGGYCELQDELQFSRSKYAFTNKTYLQKVVISFAGIGMNCWMAYLAYWLWTLTYNPIFYIFGYYSLIIGLSNALPIPALDGSFWIGFLFEKKLGKKKCYSILLSIFSKWFFWLMVLNILTIPYLIYLIWTKQILCI